MRRRSWGTAAPLAGLAVLLLGWELALRVIDLPTYLMPRPSDIAATVAENPGTLLRATWNTALASVGGLSFAILFGVGGAVLLGFSGTVERTLFPYAIVLQAVPTIALAPLLVIWLGPGMPAIVCVAAIICFFPLLSNTLVGLKSVDQDAVNLFRMYDSSRWALMRKLQLPSALPFILAGIRISGGLSIKGAVIGEFVGGVGGGRGGLGYIVKYASLNLQTSLLFAGALAGALLGIGYYALGKRVTQWLIPWHESMRGDGPENPQQLGVRSKPAAVLASG